MKDDWKKELACAMKCSACGALLEKKQQRILSVYTHTPICMTCKREEEKRPDYEDVSKAMIGKCIRESGRPYGETEGFCFNHFCPFKC